MLKQNEINSYLDNEVDIDQSIFQIGYENMKRIPTKDTKLDKVYVKNSTG